MPTPTINKNPTKTTERSFWSFRSFLSYMSSLVLCLDFKQCIIFSKIQDTNLLKENIFTHEFLHFRPNVFCFMSKVKADYNAYHTYYDKRNRHAKCFSGKAVKHYQITWKYACNASKYATYEN